jgi:phosphoribosylanthranilate isomerase
VESQPLHCVGVFRDASVEEMRRISAIAGNEYIQLHGNEPDEAVREIGKPAIKAVSVGDGVPVVATSAEWVLFDTHDAQRGGGTGRAFDWSLLTRISRSKPFFLAGGITPDNVDEAIRAVRPDGIDVATGVESAPGVKDHAKLRKLFDRVRQT